MKVDERPCFRICWGHFPDRDRRYPDPTHINSVFELTDNRWFDAGDGRFRPGNVLVSARNLNAIFIF